MSATETSRTEAPVTVAAALRRVSTRLALAGIERAQAEARLLVEAATGASRAEIIGFGERMLGTAQSESLEHLVARRCLREPVSRILGKREFWSLPFAVTPATLDPRPDSETLVSAVLQEIGDRQAALEILDLGTGTGCLLLALLSELPRARGTGVDVAPEAVATAQGNAAALGLADRAAFVVGDWARDINARFHVVISNPPYIESAAVSGLQPEVARFDPAAALDGGPDGLAAYRLLIPQAAERLVPGGLMALEIGAGQSESVDRLAADAGFTAVGTVHDLAGIPRCLLFRK